MSQDRATALAVLRRQLESKGLLSAPVSRQGATTGLPALDAVVGGWPRPGLAEIAGLPGSGRLGLVLPLLSSSSWAGRPVAIVDVLERLHPPGLPQLAWSHLLVVRAGVERAAWAAEQLAGSGGVAATVLLDPGPLGRAGYRLLRAAEQGGSTVLVLAERAEQSLPASLRLQTLGSADGRLRFRVLRARGRGAGERVLELPLGAYSSSSG